jgi:hypothetical protein
MGESEKAIARVLAKRQAAKGAAKPFDITKFLFPEQLAFVRDPSPNKSAVCSRRAGKTIACAAHLIDTALSEDGIVCLYITLSRNNAKKIIWRELKKINRDYKLNGEENLSELSITFPNHSVIYLSGAKDTNEIEKFRGLAIKLCYIDEAQSFREYIRELIDDVLSPALMDYAGTLALIGTPGAIPTGYFHECTQEASNWSKHHWTFWNNPYILDKSKLTHQQMLDRELKRRGVSAADPSIQREWFGKWVLDSDSLLIHYNPNVAHYDYLPALPFGNHKYEYIMGVDLGFNDADAIAILAWSEHLPTTYLVEELVTEKQGITELVQQIESLSKKYNVSKIVMDEGGLGKKIAEEMRRQKHIPIQGADKKLKMQNIAFLNDALRTGKFKAKANSKFAQDTYLVEIDRDKSTPDKIAVSSKYHSDIIDAVLYSFKESPAFTYQAPSKKLIPGTKEWADAQENDMFDQELEGLQKEEQYRKWENGYDD